MGRSNACCLQPSCTNGAATDLPLCRAGATRCTCSSTAAAAASRARACAATCLPPRCAAATLGAACWAAASAVRCCAGGAACDVCWHSRQTTYVVAGLPDSCSTPSPPHACCTLTLLSASLTAVQAGPGRRLAAGADCQPVYMGQPPGCHGGRLHPPAARAAPHHEPPAELARRGGCRGGGGGAGSRQRRPAQPSRSGLPSRAAVPSARQGLHAAPQVSGRQGRGAEGWLAVAGGLHLLRCCAGGCF